MLRDRLDLFRMTPTPPTSARLRRAAAAEQAELQRHRERLLQRRGALRTELEELERGLLAVDEQLGMLRRLAGDQLVEREEPALPEGRTLLRGTAIRETAVKLLLSQANAPSALHYRDWFERLGQAGYVVGGKDPLATFLTQISRSPVVRRSTQAGVYEVDRTVPSRLRQRLAQLQAELRESTTGGGNDLRELRARRDEITSAIAGVERALEEAERVLEEAPGDHVAASA